MPRYNAYLQLQIFLDAEDDREVRRLISDGVRFEGMEDHDLDWWVSDLTIEEEEEDDYSADVEVYPFALPEDDLNT